MSKIKIYVENGQVIITPVISTLVAGGKPIALQRFPTNDVLTASVVDTDKVKVVHENGKVIFTKVAISNLVGKDGSTAISGADAAAKVATLNGSDYFAAGTLESKITTEKNRVDGLGGVLKDTVGGGGKGIYTNTTKVTTDAHVTVASLSAKVRVNASTGMDFSQSTSNGPGSVSLSVQAGTSPSSVEAIAIDGDAALNNATINLRQPVTFSSTATGLNGSALTAGSVPDARIASSSVTQHAGDIQLSDLSNVDTHAPEANEVLTWDNVNSYWAPAAAPGTDNSLASSISDIMQLSGQEIQGKDPGTGDKLVAWDDSASKLTYFTPSSAFSIQGTNISVRTYANSDQTLAANRNIDMNNKFLTFKDGSNTKLQYNPNTDFFTFTNGLQVNGDFRVVSSSGLAGSQIKLQEPAMGGSNAVILQAPTTNLTADVTFVMPDADGSDGHFLQTDGSGNLSFAAASGGGSSSKVYTFYDAGRRQWSSSQDNYYHYGDASYGLSDNAKSGAISSYTTGSLVSNLIDDFQFNSFVVPADCTKAEIRGWMHTSSSALAGKTMDIYVYKIVPSNTTGATQHTATELLNVQKTLPSSIRRVLAFNVKTTSAGLSAGDLLHVVMKPTGVNTNSTHYLQYTYTLTLEE